MVIEMGKQYVYVHRIVKVEIPEGHKECPRCSGRGMIRVNPCYECSGEGYIEIKGTHDWECVGRVPSGGIAGGDDIFKCSNCGRTTLEPRRHIKGCFKNE